MQYWTVLNRTMSPSPFFNTDNHFPLQSMRSNRTSSACSLTLCREQSTTRWSPKIWSTSMIQGKQGMHLISERIWCWSFVFLLFSRWHCCLQYCVHSCSYLVPPKMLLPFKRYICSLMFAIPRLAIVCGLVVFPTGPLNVERETADFPELFRWD